MPLSTEQRAQLVAMFGKSRGRFRLTARQQELLVEECVKTDRTAAEINLDVPVDESEGLVEEMNDLSKDAGMTKLSDVNGVARWATAKTLATDLTPDSRASAVLDLLVERGVSVPSAVQQEVTATLRQIGDFGDVLSQSKSSMAICIIYTGELPGAELVEWHAARARGLSGGAGKVDLRSCLIYQKLHSKTSKTTLERALLDRDPSNRKLTVVKDSVSELLYAASLPLAATRWQQVLGFAASHFRHDPAKERIYLWGYFFSTYLGLGMSEVRDTTTLLDMLAPTPGGGASAIESEMRPTVPGENLSAGQPQFGLGGGALPASDGLASVIMLQQQQMAAITRALSELGVRGGEALEEPPIKELPAPKPLAWKCIFCHAEHDPSQKCAAMKQALRLKSDWDKEQAKSRRAAEEAAKAAGAGAPLPAMGRGTAMAPPP